MKVRIQADADFNQNIVPAVRRRAPVLEFQTAGRSDREWSPDITSVHLQSGFVYLVAVMDWFRRYVLSWAVSITLEVAFCLEALDHVLSRGQPEIFNTDQGG